MENQENQGLDLLDYYSIMDRTGVILMTFSDMADLAKQCPKLSQEVTDLEERLAKFYQMTADRFEEEMELAPEEEI